MSIHTGTHAHKVLDVLCTPFSEHFFRRQCSYIKFLNLLSHWLAFIKSNFIAQYIPEKVFKISNKEVQIKTIIRASRGGIVSLVPEHYNKVNAAVKGVTILEVPQCI